MKSVILSVRPKHCEKIASGKKTIEVRKSAPKEVPFKVYIYCTKTKNKWSLCDYEGAYQNSDGEIVYAQQHVIGEFICDNVVKYDYQVIACAKYEINGANIKEELRYNAGACLAAEEMFSYSKGKTLYGWHISKLKIYDNPIRLSEFERPCPYRRNCHSECQKGKFKNDGFFVCSSKIARPPRSWQYAEKMERFSQGV